MERKHAIIALIFTLLLSLSCEKSLAQTAVSATSATFANTFQGGSGNYWLFFSDGSEQTVSLTGGSTAVSWSATVSGSAFAATCPYGTYPNNSGWVISYDKTHPTVTGNQFLGEITYDGISQALASF